MRLAVTYWPTPRSCCQTFPIRRKSLKRRALWPTSKFCPVERSETGATIWLCIARQLRLRNQARRISRQRPNLFKLTSSLKAWAIYFELPNLCCLSFLSSWQNGNLKTFSHVDCSNWMPGGFLLCIVLMFLTAEMQVFCQHTNTCFTIRLSILPST